LFGGCADFQVFTALLAHRINSGRYLQHLLACGVNVDRYLQYLLRAESIIIIIYSTFGTPSQLLFTTLLAREINFGRYLQYFSRVESRKVNSDRYLQYFWRTVQLCLPDTKSALFQCDRHKSKCAGTPGISASQVQLCLPDIKVLHFNAIDAQIHVCRDA